MKSKQAGFLWKNTASVSLPPPKNAISGFGGEEEISVGGAGWALKPARALKNSKLPKKVERLGNCALKTSARVL